MGRLYDTIFGLTPAVVFIIIILNALVWWVRGRHIRRDFPDRKAGYKRILTWFIGYTALVCGLAHLEFVTGSNKTIIDIGKFGIGAAFLTFALSPLLAIYIYKFNGAEDLIKHPGLINKKALHISEATQWKLLPVLIFIAHAVFVLKLLRLCQGQT